MCYNYFNGETKKATEMQIHAIPLINSLFSEVNPIPVKEALNIIGYEFGQPRLPLIPMSNDKKEILKKCIDEFQQNFHIFNYCTIGKKML